MWFDIFITILFVFINGFFVAAEFALVRVRQSQIELKAREGNRMAVVVKGIIKRMDAYLSASQLGITLASLGLGWIGESVVTRIMLSAIHGLGFGLSEDTAHKIALPVAFAVITSLHIVFGEQAPKYLALQRSESTSLAVAFPLRIFFYLFRPFVWVLNGMSNFILRLIGVEVRSEHEVHSPQELLYILEESRSGGVIRSSEHQMLENVFEFYDRPAREIMVPRTSVISVSLEDDRGSVIDKVVSEGYSRLPVYEDNIDNIRGIIHAKDVLMAMHTGNEDPLHTLLRPAYFVPESKKIGNLLRDMQQKHVQIAIVLDEYGGTSGIVTLEDIMEELVGEIQDEYDDERPWVEKTGENEYLVQARTAILDANENLPEMLPEGEDYDTVGGYINFLFGRIPEVKEEITAGHYRITVMQKKAHHVEAVRLKYTPPAPEVTE